MDNELSVPDAIADLSPEWLTSALISRGHLTRGRVVAVERQLLSVGVGFIGDVARLTLSYEGARAGPASVIAKMPRPDPVLRERTRALRLYEREIGFYEELAPHTPMKLPRCWYTAMDTVADRYVLLLEDMAPARTGDQIAGCQPAEARLVVRELGRLHATWWRNAWIETLDWLFPVNDPRQKSLEERYSEALPAALARWGDLLSPEMRRFAEDYATRFGWVVDRILEMPNTVQHADVRLDNILFGGAPGGDWVSILDWQAPTRGGGMQDVAYFITQSLTVETRRLHERELVDLYLATLAEGGVRDYPREQALEEYRLAMLWGWLLPVWAAGNIDLAVPRAGALWDAVLNRAVAAVEDWEGADLFARGR